MFTMKMTKIPFTQIQQMMSFFLPPDMVSLLPDKWEKIGSVLTIKVPEVLQSYKHHIGKVYAEVLGCTTTLNDVGGISGVYREPVVEVIFGSSMTETIHVENGVRFRLDPQKIMFSSGNMAERRRMATIVAKDETVVDLFAGIGYFSLPMAVHSAPKRIFACEVNPCAFQYLRENVVLNNVCGTVEPLLGDNRMVAPKQCADRVILGYLTDPQRFIGVACECLKDHTGILHYHEVVPVENVPRQPLAHIEQSVELFHRSVKLLKVNKIKSYAPRIVHVVLDVRIA
jgi:tRNA wybutosine-synthesizing protein 2